MLVVGLDTETTGLTPDDHRIIEIYVGLWNSADHKLIEEFSTKVDPERSVPPASIAIHGISSADLVGAPRFQDIAPKLLDIVGKGDLIVAHNGVGFDMPFINKSLKRFSFPEITTPCFDTFLNGKWATPQGKGPNLAELCFACNVKYDTSKAHSADYDVKVMMRSFFRGVEWGFFLGSESDAA
jgi:DNA polymerase-3 subunit epsilon